MRIAILWTGLSGYLNACLKELASRDHVELFVSHQMPVKSAPFDESQFAWMPNRLTWEKRPELKLLENRLAAFSPEIMIVPSWHVSNYRRVSRKFAGKCWRIMVMDNCWRGTPKQRLGTWIAPFYVKPITDAVWLPGERQAVFARKLGFDQSAILHGSFSCDQHAFDSLHRSRLAEGRALPHSFLFVGRFIPEKGLNTLLEAYAMYRETATDPWPMVCCGEGPLRPLLEGKEGIRLEGFVQPERMPAIFGAAGCLILPSVFEPWGLVIHEAASAGVPILASEQVGAVPHLVQPGYNGFVFGKKDPVGLARLMFQMSAMSDERLDDMSRASFLLSQQFSPRRWADTLLEAFRAQSQDHGSGVSSSAVAQ
jgi:glycosyltransferase involved in cell wall biosynthesis